MSNSRSHSNLHKNRGIYSHAFGEEVVSRFLDSYARATHFVADGVDYDYVTFCQVLIRYVRFSQFRWEAMKKLIKCVDRDPGIQSILRDRSIKASEKRKYLTIVNSHMVDLLLDEDLAERSVDKQLDLFLP